MFESKVLGRLVPSGASEVESTLCASPGFWGWPAAVVNPLLVDASPLSLPLSLSGLLLCVYA